VVTYLSVTKVDLIEEEGSVGRARRPGGGASVLVVTNKLAATPALVEAVRARAATGSAEFLVLVPNPSHLAFDRAGAETHQAADVVAAGLPALEQAAGTAIDVRVAHSPNAFDDIVAALDTGDYDEIILETPPSHVSHWLHVDLSQRIAHLGYPLLAVAASH